MNKNNFLPSKKTAINLSFISLGIFAIIVSIISISASAPNKPATSNFQQDYNIYSIPLPDSANFAGEKVNYALIDVRERFERELLINTFWQSQTMLFLKRSTRWFPVIEKILEEEGVPADFKYLSLIESGFTNSASPAGACGFWQILKTTATENGLEVNDNIDERYNVYKSTRVACKYFKDAKAKFGSWTMAAASYNMGIRGLENQTKRQKQSDYYHLLLNEETSRYVFRILAAKTILSNPSFYGFNIKPEEYYPSFETYTITVDSSISDIAEFAFSHNINYKVVKLFNPWLRDNFLINKSGKVYEIVLPHEKHLSVLMGTTSN